MSWFDDFSDIELLELIPLLEKLNEVDDVCAFLRNDNVNTVKTRCHPFDTSWFTVNHFIDNFHSFLKVFFPIVHNALSSEIMVVILLRSRQCIFFEVGIFAKYWDAQPSCTVDLALVASFKRWILLYPLHEVDNSILVSLKVVRRIVIYLVDSIIQCLGPIMINIGKHCAFTGKLCS